jgi:hypothetical protein
MRLLISAAVLCFLIGAPTFAYQKEQPQQQDEKTKPKQEEKQKPQEPKTERKQQEEPAKQDERTRQDDRAKQQQQDEKARQQQDEKARQQQSRQQQDERARQEQTSKQQEKQQKETEKQQRAQQQQRQADDRNRAELQRADQSARHDEHRGRRIPDERFHADFGREHHFHAGIHRGERTFAYGGYNFQFVEAWPAVWRYDDDFYIDYIDDEYYLCDVEHPEVRLVVIIE